MTNAQLALLIIDKLSVIYEKSEARAIQRYLFTSLSSKSLVELLVSSNEQADAEFEEKVISLLPSLLEHVPVQYVTGMAWFCDLKLEVTPDVLIPRPETEQLVYLILEDLKNETELSILDIGTGSGAIAVSVAFNKKDAHVTAIDISDKALDIARLNASKYNLEIDFMQINILEQDDYRVFNGKEFDVIISNPPYVKKSEVMYMDKNVLNYEPHQALFVNDDDPLIFYRKILEFSRLHLVQNGYLYLEINEVEGDNLKELISSFDYNSCEVFNDFNDKARFIRARK